MSDPKTISRKLAGAMALFVALPVAVLPMAAQAQTKTSGRRLRRVRNLRRDIGDLRTGVRADTKLDVDTKVLIRDLRTDLRDFRTGLRDNNN